MVPLLDQCFTPMHSSLILRPVCIPIHSYFLLRLEVASSESVIILFLDKTRIGCILIHSKTGFILVHSGFILREESFLAISCTIFNTCHFEDASPKLIHEEVYIKANPKALNPTNEYFSPN